MTLVMVCTAAALAQAIEMSGTVEAGVDLLPAFGVEVDLETSLSGEAWSVLSETYVPMIPLFGASESLTMSYDLDVAQLEVDVDASLVPLSLVTVDASVTVGLFEREIPEVDPVASLSSDLILGAVFDGAVDPYISVYTLLSHGSSWLSNTTTLSLGPVDLAASLLAYLSLGTAGLGESGVTVTTYGYVSTDVIPLDFSYAQLNVLLNAAGSSVLGTVTYYGGESFVAKTTVTLDLDTLAIGVWGSYTSTSSDPVGFGVSVSIPWGLP
jgi:hypothetical protein